MRLLIAFLILQIVSFGQARTGGVAGQILGLDGAPAAGIRVAVAALRANGGIDALIGIATTDESGHYRIEDVLPGRYGVIAGAVASPTYYPGTADGGAAEPVVITAGTTLDGTDFTLTISAISPDDLVRMVARYSFRGQIVVENGTLPPGAAGGFRLSYSGSESGSISPQPDGTFQVVLTSGGTYKFQAARDVFFRPNNDFYVKAITFEKRSAAAFASGPTDITRTPMSFTFSTRGEIRVTLALTHPIRGNVRTEQGLPAANIQVYLLPTPAQVAAMGSSIIGGIGNSSGATEELLVLATAVTDERGDFAIRGVPPGDYTLHSDAKGQPAGGLPLTVGPEPAPFVDLVLISGPLLRRLAVR